MQALAEERKAIAQLEKNKDFYEKLDIDLEAVKNDPRLAAEFKRIYPERFHKHLELMGITDTIREEQPTSQKTQAVKDPRIDEIYQDLQERKAQADEQRQAAASDFVNATFDRMNQKYPDALEENVLAKVIRLNELHQENPREYKKPDEKVIEELFKASHEAQLGYAKSYMERTLNAQKSVNEKAKGPASGGGIPGGAPRTPRNIKEATEMALNDPSW
jgi:hypothetical protein